MLVVMTGEISSRVFSSSNPTFVMLPHYFPLRQICSIFAQEIQVLPLTKH